MNQDLRDNVDRLLAAVRRGLAARPGEGVDDVLGCLAAQDTSPASYRAPEPRGLPVLVHLPQCIGEVMLLDPDLAAAFVAVEEALQWRQSSVYNDEVLGDGFMANYGWAEIIGPRGFLAGDDVLLGFLMLGPHRHYPDHYHPAPELYWPLTSGTSWSRDGEPFAVKPQGATIWHPSMALHAMITGDMPLLALWCWTSDTATPARLRRT